MEADLIHVGAVIAFGGFAACHWAGARSQSALWVLPAMAFLIAAAFAAGWA